MLNKPSALSGFHAARFVSAPRHLLGAAAAACAVMATSSVWAGAADAGKDNAVNFSATATEELVQDQMSVTLQVIKEGAVASEVQAALKSALDAALQDARKSVVAGALEVKTGSFSVSPRYSSNGKIAGWQGHAQLVVEGTDTARISQVVGKLNQLNVVGVQYGLSRGLREARESALTTQAIARFRARASQMAKDFGFKSYELGEVSVSSTDPGFEGRPPMLYAMRAKSVEMADAALPSEPGKGTLSVTVSGKVMLTP